MLLVYSDSLLNEGVYHFAVIFCWLVSEAIGNPRFKFVKTLNDPRFGKVSIVKEPSTGNVLVVSEKMINNKKEVGKEIINARNRLNISHPNILSLRDYGIEKKSGLCSTNYIFKYFYNYPNQDL